MSWIDKELRRRERQEARANAKHDSVPAGDDAADESAKISALWDRFEAINEALPEKLQLKRDISDGKGFPSERSIFLIFLSAKNGAGIGYTGDGIRYIWPQKHTRSSYNFWIRWNPGQGFQVSRRVKPTMFRPGTDERAFHEPAIDHIFKCLVTDTRVRFRSVRKKRLWLF